MKNKLSFSVLAIVAFLAFSFTGPGARNAATFKVDTKKSTIVWTGKKVTGAHTGHVSIASGNLIVDDKAVKGGLFDIDLTSITVTDLKDPEYNAKLVGHLKNDDFFGTEKFPKATFVISTVTHKEGNNYDVTGKLTIKGITNDVAFPAVIAITPAGVTATAQIKVDRTKYGIKYGSGSFFDNLGDKAIDNDFLLDVNLVATK